MSGYVPPAETRPEVPGERAQALHHLEGAVIFITSPRPAFLLQASGTAEEVGMVLGPGASLTGTILFITCSCSVFQGLTAHRR